MRVWNRSTRVRGGWGRIGMAVAAAAVTFLPVSAGMGQIQQPQQPTFGQGPPRASNDPLRPSEPPDPFAASNAAKIAHMREDERHKRLAADTAKLVELTNELKTEVDKASKDELSLDVVRKAAEIEKLAHDVKERMKS
jgi:hypothetical protein